MLEHINFEAARIVTGATQLTSISLLLKETSWDTLEERRRKHKLILFYKMYHRMTPNYLSGLVPSSNYEMHSYNTRHQNNVLLIPCNSESYFKPFLPSVIRDWNNIPFEIRQASLCSFKKYLNQNLEEVSKYFLVGDRIGQIH